MIISFNFEKLTNYGKLDLIKNYYNCMYIDDIYKILDSIDFDKCIKNFDIFEGISSLLCDILFYKSIINAEYFSKYKSIFNTYLVKLQDWNNLLKFNNGNIDNIELNEEYIKHYSEFEVYNFYETFDINYIDIAIKYIKLSGKKIHSKNILYHKRLDVLMKLLDHNLIYVKSYKMDLFNFSELNIIDFKNIIIKLKEFEDVKIDISEIPNQGIFDLLVELDCVNLTIREFLYYQNNIENMFKLIEISGIENINFECDISALFVNLFVNDIKVIKNKNYSILIHRLFNMIVKDNLKINFNALIDKRNIPDKELFESVRNYCYDLDNLFDIYIMAKFYNDRFMDWIVKFNISNFSRIEFGYLDRFCSEYKEYWEPYFILSGVI